MKTDKHTPGPWRWEFNGKNGQIVLCGGAPAFDKNVMQFERWGTSGASPLFNSAIFSGYNEMRRPCEEPGWVAPFDGREHHSAWLATLTHPDAVLIAAAPALLDALRIAARILSEYAGPEATTAYRQAEAAIQVATGGAK
jgi:hypothetical protein